MKIYLIMTALLCIIMLLLPIIPKTLSEKKDVFPQTTLIQDTSTKEDNNEIKVFRTETKSVSNIDFYEYIVGTVAGEMPASFSEEALKAQAVVSYTYARWILGNNPTNKLISDSSSLHQKYIDKDEQKEKWQDNYETNRKIIKNAVESVYGEYLSYNGETAMTVFHALSNGNTLSAEEVWGNNIPYLKATTAPGDILAEKYESTVTFTAEEFRKLFEEYGVKLDTENYKSIILAKELNPDGYIKTLTIASTDFSSRDVRKILSLPGNSFKMLIKDNSVSFIVHGRGHGVGMSQYSADYMARQGYSYKEILAHFYPGTTLISE